MAANALCLVIGSGFLAHQHYALNPDAVASVGAACSVRALATDPSALSIVVEGNLRDRLIGIAEVAAGEHTAKLLFAATCPDSASRVILLDQAGRDPQQGVVAWHPAHLDNGGGPAPEIDRALRELLGIAVARPLPPWNHRVSLLQLPKASSEASLLMAAFQSPWTSWITLHGKLFLVSDMPDQLADLTKEYGANLIAENIELGQLRLTGADLPDGARVLSDSSDLRLTLCPSGCADGVGWLARRFDRIDDSD